LREIEIVQAEVAQIWRDKVLEQRLAALIAKEDFIADEHVSGAELAAGNIRGELFCLSKAFIAAPALRRKTTGGH
jgi:hypothetical protein